MPDSFLDLKRKNLEKRLADLHQEYEVANQQLSRALSDVERLRLQRQISDLEREIWQIENDLGHTIYLESNDTLKKKVIIGAICWGIGWWVVGIIYDVSIWMMEGQTNWQMYAIIGAAASGGLTFALAWISTRSIEEGIQAATIGAIIGASGWVIYWALYGTAFWPIGWMSSSSINATIWFYVGSTVVGFIIGGVWAIISHTVGNNK